MMRALSSPRAWLLLAAVPLVALAVLWVTGGAPPAQAQDTVTLVSNAGQTPSGTADHGGSLQSQGFTTGTHELGYVLSSIEATINGNHDPSQAQSGTVRAELWSSTTGGAPKEKIVSLTVPTDIGTGVVSFAAPSNTPLLTARTIYHLVTWTDGSYAFSLAAALSDDEGTKATGWSIANSRRWVGVDDPDDLSQSDRWDTANPAESILISVKGAAKQPPTITLSSSDADNSVAETNADQTVTLTATLNEAAGMDGVTVALARQSGSTATATSDYTLSTASISIASGATSGTATLTIKGDELVEDTEKLVLAATATSWESGSLTVTITDDDAGAAKIAFGNDAAAATAYTNQELEDVVAGTYDVPVTVSHLPQASTSFTINVLTTGTNRATQNTDYSIPASVSFGPSDTSKTKNVTITLTDDMLVEDSETVSLQIAAARPSSHMDFDLGDHYTRHTNGSKATITILDDDASNAKIAFGDNAAGTATWTRTVDEDLSGGTLTVPITISHLPDGPTTFTVSVLSGGTATEWASTQNPGDFRISNKTVSFSNTGLKKKNLTITLTNDVFVEVDQTIQLQIAAADDPKNDLGDHYTRHTNGSKATVTIDDDESDDAKVAFSRSATSTVKYSIGVSESGGTLNIPITISHKPEDDTTFTVNVLTTGTATENTDYTIGTKSFTFTKTGVTTQNLVVALTNDDLVELDQTVELEIASGTGLFSHYERNAMGKLAKASIFDDERGVAKIAIGSSATSTTKYTDTGAEGDGTLTVPITISHLPESAITFAVEVTGGKARESDDQDNPTGNPKDYEFVAKTLQFDATPNGFEKTLTINIADDNVEEDNEEIQFRIVGPDTSPNDLGDYYGRDTNGSTATITLTSEDQVTTVTLKVDRTASSTGEFDVVEGSNVTVTATANRPVGPDGWRIETENTYITQPPYGGMQGTISGGCQRTGQWPGWACPNDYRLPAAFTIQEGQTEATATLHLVSDSRMEDNEERLRLRATATRRTRTLTTSSLDLHISDTNAGVSVSAPTFDLVPTETAIYTVSLRGVQPTQNVTITPTSSDATKARVTCAADPCELTFTPQNWEDAQQITVTAVAVGKATITHAATSTDTTYNGLSSLGPVVVTVEAAAQNFRIEPSAAASEGESAELRVTLGALAPTGGLTFTVDRSRTNDLKYLTNNPPAQSPENGLADPAADLDSPPTTVTVPVGKRTVTVTDPIATDERVEGDEHYYVVISTSTSGWSPAARSPSSTTYQHCNIDPSFSSLGDQDAACARVDIDDADNAAAIAFGNSATATTVYSDSASEAGATLNVPVTVSALPAATTVFDIEVVTTGSGLATEGTDYTIATKSVTFGPTDSTTTKNITITTTDDSVAEGDETIRLRIAAGGSGLAGRYQRDPNGTQATVTITDNDGAVEVSQASVGVRPGATATYTVQLMGAQPSSNVTVTVASGDETKATVNPTLLTFDSGNWNRPQTVTVSGVAEGTATITHTVGGTDAAYPSTLSVDSVDVTVTALPTASLEVSPNPVREGSSITVTVVLSEAIGTVKTLPILLTSTTAEDTDYEALANIAINSGSTRHTATIRTNHDDDFDDEKFTVALVNLPSSVAAGTPVEVTVTIEDDDTPERRRPRGPGGPTGGGPPALSSDATLSGLSLTAGGETVALEEAFNPGTTAYTANAPHTTTAVTVSATARHSAARVSILPADADAETEGHQIRLAAGTNTITITVTAQNSSRQTYTVTITQAPAPQPTLAGPAEAQPSLEDIKMRDQLIADQEALLNVYRCMFGIDTHVVPGGCARESESTTTTAQ